MTLSKKSKPVLVSILGLILYQAGLMLPMPWLNTYLPEQVLPITQYAGSFSLFALGLAPVITGFFLIELLSFFLPPLKRWREQGFLGRSYLNRSSLIAAVPIGVLQSYFLVQWILSADTSDGLPLFDNSSLWIQLSSIAFFIGGTFLLYIVGRTMTQKGLANGFGLILLYSLCVGGTQNLIGYAQSSLQPGSEINYPGFVFLVLILAVLYRLLKQRPASETEYHGTQAVYRHPTLPQGVFSLIWTSSLIMLPVTFAQFYPMTGALNEGLTAWSYAILYLLLLLPVSWFCYYIAYSPRRVQNNLGPTGTLGQNFHSDSIRNFVLCTLFISGAAFLFLIPEPFMGDRGLLPRIWTLAELLLIGFIAKDIYEHYQFIQAYSEHVCLGEFDNIHLMTVVEGLLEKEAAPYHVQGYRLRHIYAFVNPLYKMRLLVSKSHADLASKLIGIDKIKIV